MSASWIIIGDLMQLKRVNKKGKYFWIARDDRGMFIATFKAKNKITAKEKLKVLLSVQQITPISATTTLVSRYDKQKSRSIGTYQYFFEGYYQGKYIASTSLQHENDHPTEMARAEALENFQMALSGAHLGNGKSDPYDGKIVFSDLKDVKEGIRYFRGMKRSS